MRLKYIKSVTSGFTLIEILVVIAIIAVLAAILFPVFGRARENARRSTCQSNLKQLGLAFTQYTQDYDETYPIWHSNSTASGNPTVSCWDIALAPYAGVTVDPNVAPTIFKCPSDSIQRNPATNGGRSYSVPMVSLGTNNDFSLAANVIDSGSVQHILLGRRISTVPVPAETLLLVERPFDQNLFGSRLGAVAGCAESNGANCTQPPVTSGNPATGSPINLAQDAGMPGRQEHFNGWNYLFCDGHVKWLRAENTIDLNPNDSFVGNMLLPRGMWSVREGD